MDYADSSLDAKSNPHLQAVAEQLFRIEHTQQRMKTAQRSAAESFVTSADSHDRTARSYQKLAELGEGAEYLERAARHREFAREDA